MSRFQPTLPFAESVGHESQVKRSGTLKEVRS
jgi:hypothetical protein